MPPFPLPINPTPLSRTDSVASDSTTSTSATPVSPTAGSTFTSLLKTFGRGVSKATHAHPAPSPVPGTEKPRMVGSSSRSAGVRPSKGTAGSGDERRERSDELEYSMARQALQDLGPPIAGPSRGGFVSSLHAPIASTSKSLPTTAPSSGTRVDPIAISSRSTSPPALVPPMLSRRGSLAPEAIITTPIIESEDDITPPPSKILPRLTAEALISPDPSRLLPLIRLLAKSVSLYPFPPPSLSAASLSAALSTYAATPTSEKPPPLVAASGVMPPSPLQIYVSQSHLLRSDSNAEVRAALLELLRASVDSSLASTGGMKETEKAIYWNEARRWAEEAKEETTVNGEVRWKLPVADREALVAVLSSLTRGGRDLSDVPGLVALLCTFVADSIPSPPPPSPLYDDTLKTFFLRSLPASAPHSTSLALLTALHKFSAPQVYSASTLLAIKAVLQVAKSPNEQDFAGDSGVLGFLGAVIRFGEVTPSKSIPGTATRVVNEGDEILKDVVSLVSRIIGCEGIIGVVDSNTTAAIPAVHDERIYSSILPPIALQLMRDLLRSPANQALKSLRNSLIAPPMPGSDLSPVLPPVLLLVGTLRALRNALLEYSADAEASVDRGESSLLSTGESRWPSMLALGLPFVWNGLRRVMNWKSSFIDAEVLGLVEERLEASRRKGVRAREVLELEESTGTRGKDLEVIETGVSYEEWDMAIEVLSTTSSHIAAWETSNKQSWTVEESLAGLAIQASSPQDELSPPFAPRPTALAAFSSLLLRVLRAWFTTDFSGPSERFFALLLSVAPHLSESDSLAVMEQCERSNLCLPSHPDWLERIQGVLQAFYVVSSKPGNMKSKRVASTATRRRALQLLTSVHSHVRQLSTLSKKLVASMILPLLESTSEDEMDVDVADELMELVIEIARDAVIEEGIEDEPLETFDRLRLLLVRLAKGREDKKSSTLTPNNSRSRKPVGLTSLSKYQKEDLRSPPTTSTSPSTTLGTPTTASVSSTSILTLISLFHLCLDRSTRSASQKAIAIYRDLLSFLAPESLVPATIQPAGLNEGLLSVRGRFLILQWMVRLRADANHRIQWIQKVDITVAAEILGRLENSDESNSRNLVEEGGRGRTARAIEPISRGDREISGSRGRMRSEDPSPSRRATSRARLPSLPTLTPSLWSIPEALPFKLGSASSAIGSDGLASFDHNQMRNWTEEEDPGTGLMKVKEADQTTVVAADLMVVLPVSEYLGAISRLLSYEKDWEIISYILCYLPEQLSNKHFACGPRGAQQIHALRRQLCDGLRGGEKVFLTDVILPGGLKRAEVHAVSYQCLTALIAYRSLFNKSQQDEMVETFMFGLGNPRDTAKPCIHALAVACFELRPSMTKHLAEIVRHLQKIISSAELGVHILELIAGIGQEPDLYANFIEQDFQTVFGIALKYIQAHNERLGENAEEEGAKPGEELDYAFSQYVFLLAYYAIAAWYMALRLSDRPKYVPFLIRRLVQANEGRTKIDEATEVCFDMIARYAYSNADPRPRQSTFDKIITSGRTSTAISKTWIIGTAFVTVRNLQAPAWVEVTIRRASGVVKMLWELQNVSGMASSSDCDLIAMYLRHRETNQVGSSGMRSIVSEALDLLPTAKSPPHLGQRARAKSFAGVGATRDALQIIEQNTFEGVINSAAATAAQPTLESGPLAVDPSFFALQLSTIPDFGESGPPILIPSDPSYQRGITILDTMPVVDFHKIGILYVGAGQTTEMEILSNQFGSKAYIELISGLGKLIRLKGSRSLDVYTGGLDAENDLDGKWTYIWDDDISQIVYHIATLMPTNLSTDPQLTLKKRHIGNDYVKVVYNDSGLEFKFETLPGDFNFVNIVIEPHTPAGNPWIGPGMTNNAQFFKVSMQCRKGMPEIGPLGSCKMVAGAHLPAFVRQLSLHSNIFAQIYLATVGINARHGNQKLEYSSNWRKRLQAIKALRARLERNPVSPLQTEMDVEAEEMKRNFASWL